MPRAGDGDDGGLPARLGCRRGRLATAQRCASLHSRVSRCACTALQRDLRAPFPEEGDCSPRGRQAPGRGTPLHPPAEGRGGVSLRPGTQQHPGVWVLARRLPAYPGMSMPRFPAHPCMPLLRLPSHPGMPVPRVPDAPQGADPCNVRGAGTPGTGVAGAPVPVLPILRSSPRPGMPAPRVPGMSVPAAPRDADAAGPHPAPG